MLDSNIVTKCLVSSKIVLVEIESPDVIISSSYSSYLASLIDCFVFWWDFVIFESTIANRRLKPTQSLTVSASSADQDSNCVKVL